MYSRYELSQMQRAKERNVRKWKKTWMIEKKAGLDTTGSAIRLRNTRKSLSDFAKATGGRVDSARTATWNTSKLPCITDEQLQWLMDEHGKGITREKNVAAGIQEQLDAVNATLKAAQDSLKAFEGVDVTELQGKVVL